MILTQNKAAITRHYYKSGSEAVVTRKATVSDNPDTMLRNYLEEETSLIKRLKNNLRKNFPDLVKNAS